ncbi:MAG: TonB-dependent receptor [Calditrichaeota bacterium]|nr:TonB-dependent receptor [Calditrichota bacterium]
MLKNRLVFSSYIYPGITFWVIFFSFSICFAGTTGKIAGTVLTDGADVLAGANIILKAKIVNEKEMPLNTPMGAASDVNGEFYILNVPPGSYVVECSMIGFKNIIQKPVYVAVDRTTSLDFSLKEEYLEGEEITVIVDRPMVVKDLTASSAKVSGATIEALPVESFDEVLALQAGITTGINGGLHIRGGRSSEIKYYVDGIAVSNPFDNSLAVPVETNSIEELEVISGTFNAEYGQAQSGIVNIVTREGTQEFTGGISVYTGDYISNHDSYFKYIGNINPLSQKYLEASLSGPFFINKLTFFASTKLTDNDNWLYGQRIFEPGDSSNFSSSNSKNWYVGKSGDGAYVSMNSGNSYTAQFKLAYQISSTLKLTYNLINNYSEGKIYNANFRLNPDGLRNQYINSQNHFIGLSHTINTSMFYNLKFAFYENDYKSYVHKNVFHPEYAAIYRPSTSEPGNVFNTGGIDGTQIFRNSKSYAFKGDFNWQSDKYNLWKAGFEYRQHDLAYNGYNIEVNSLLNRWLIPEISSVDHNRYNHSPVEASVYLQDKIEINDFIVNAGVRFDYFEPDGRIPVDLRDPNNNLYPTSLDSAYKSATSKIQISPRIGLAFPISEKGVVHAAYGQFFQIPEFERLYENPEFEVGSSFNGFIGNADLDAQRTDMYEIGLQQELANFLAVDITGYYRNVRQLLGSELNQTYRTDVVYGRYLNNSYGNVQGVVFAAKIRVPQYGVTADLNYTYQSAKGVASDPKQSFYDQTSTTESLITLNPLSWDLQHTFSAFINYNQKPWNGSVIVRTNSGYPFTPGGYAELRNQGRFKGDLFVDLNISHTFDFDKMNIEIFAKIINLFDKTREDLLPQINPAEIEAHNDIGKNLINTLYEYSYNPAGQPAPREVRIGTKFSF